MEELLARINYLIREKLWCSIRSLCDSVSLNFLILNCCHSCRPKWLFLDLAQILTTFSFLLFQEMEKGADPVLVFWKAYGIFNEGNVNEAIRELTRVQDRREIQFAAAQALIFYHERCRNID